MTEPTALVVGAKTYNITWDMESWVEHATDTNGLGETNHRKLWIGINPAQHRAQRVDTLLHEVLHVVLAQSGDLRNYESLDDKLEEHIVVSATPWLLVVLQDNPEIVAYLLETE